MNKTDTAVPTDRKKIYEAALKETEKLFFMFEDVLCRDGEAGEKPHPESDFSYAVAKHFRKEEDLRYSMDFDALEKDCLSCRRCFLRQRSSAVDFGDGSRIRPDVFAVSSYPCTGEEEALLDRMLAAIGLKKDTNCYVSSIVKCSAEGIERENADGKGQDCRDVCGVYLMQQLALLQPKAILCLGKDAFSFVTEKEASSVEEVRGRFVLFDRSIPLICTYSLEEIIENGQYKRPVWDDLRKLARLLGLPVAGASR